jgi:saccharopine dehydrogenase-like NADP-dependent oxidoreductase
MFQNRNLRVLVLGAGKVGSTVADMLAENYGVHVTLADRVTPLHASSDALVKRISLNVEDGAALSQALDQHQAVVNALPFFHAARVAQAAAAAHLHYFDLTEDVAATTAIRNIAKSAQSALMPQCGLAPGVIGMLGASLAENFEDLYDLRMRVGALTRNPTNELRYNFTWSIDGVINEYCNPCEAIVHGQLTSVQPLEGYETFTLEGDDFEAFNTSGGLGTLCETLKGKVRNLDYKTIRYPGHRQGMQFLLHDLRLIERRDLLREVLEHAVPHSRQDVVIMFASASGKRDGRFEQDTRSAHIFGDVLRGTERTAIELTTAAGICGAFELQFSGKLPTQGFVSQEEVSLDAFLNTRVGHYYRALAPNFDAHRSQASVA